MTRPLRVLHLEDSPRDAEIVRHRLHVDGLACNILVANGKDSFEAALAGEHFDLIISDSQTSSTTWSPEISLVSSNIRLSPDRARNG
jgi:CheY-like chemotaxis protein